VSLRRHARGPKCSTNLPVLAVHRLLGIAQQRADLRPAQPGLSSAPYGDFLATGQLLPGFSDGSQLAHPAGAIIGTERGLHVVSMR
jgi:hypothetical protein